MQFKMPTMVPLCSVLKKKNHTHSDFRTQPQNITFLGNKMKQYFNNIIMDPEIIVLLKQRVGFGPNSCLDFEHRAILHSDP